MSQLNNEENNVEIDENTNTNEKSKIKPSTKITIFLVIFALVAIGVTVTAIFITNRNADKKAPATPDAPTYVDVADDGLGVKSLTEQYNENDLKLSTLTDAKGTRTPTSQWDTNTNKLNIDYIQIDGLKDTTIESQINNEIKTLVYSLCSDAELNNSEIDRINISASCNANFGNVLSVNVYKYVSYKNNSKEREYSNHYLNYNLVTGEKLAFKDLFTNASIRNALAQSIYDELLANYAYDSISEDYDFLIDMSKVDLSTLEDETYVIVNKIMDNIDTIEFSFSPSYISCIVDDDTTIYIDTANIYNHIAIYNRFKTTESIFDGSYEGQKNIFVFTDRYLSESVQFTQYEDVYDNLRVEAVVEMDKSLNSNTEVKSVLTDRINKVKEEIEAIKTEARENPDKAYIYCAYYTIGTYEDYELNRLGIDNLIVTNSGYGYIYTMSKQYYDETYYAEIGEFYRAPSASVRYIFEDYPGEDNTNVVREDFNADDFESYDLYTKKTKDELLDEYYAKQQEIFNNITVIENTTP